MFEKVPRYIPHTHAHTHSVHPLSDTSVTRRTLQRPAAYTMFLFPLLILDPIQTNYFVLTPVYPSVDRIPLQYTYMYTYGLWCMYTRRTTRKYVVSVFATGVFIFNLCHVIDRPTEALRPPSFFFNIMYTRAKRTRCY